MSILGDQRVVLLHTKQTTMSGVPSVPSFGDTPFLFTIILFENGKDQGILCLKIGAPKNMSTATTLQTLG